METKILIRYLPLSEDVSQYVFDIAFGRDTDKVDYNPFITGYVEKCRLIVHDTKYTRYMDKSEYKSFWCSIILQASQGGYIEIIRSLEFIYISDPLYAMLGACKSGNMDLIDLVIKKSNNDRSSIFRNDEVDQKMWNYGLCGARAGGHTNIMELMVARGGHGITSYYPEPKSAKSELIDISEVDVYLWLEMRKAFRSGFATKGMLIAEWLLSHNFHLDIYKM